MKIIQTNNFIKISVDLQTFPSTKNPDDVGGSSEILENRNDTQKDIIRRWKKGLKRKHFPFTKEETNGGNI